MAEGTLLTHLGLHVLICIQMCHTSGNYSNQWAPFLTEPNTASESFLTQYLGSTTNRGWLEAEMSPLFYSPSLKP